jgi:hypothetical protein
MSAALIAAYETGLRKEMSERHTLERAIAELRAESRATRDGTTAALAAIRSKGFEELRRAVSLAAHAGAVSQRREALIARATGRARLLRAARACFASWRDLSSDLAQSRRDAELRARGVQGAALRRWAVGGAVQGERARFFGRLQEVRWRRHHRRVLQRWGAVARRRRRGDAVRPPFALHSHSC